MLLPFFALVFIIIDTSYGLFVRATLQYAVQQGVSFGATGGTTAGIQSTVNAQSLGLVPSGNVNVNFYAPSTDNTNPAPGAGSDVAGNLVEVDVTYQFAAAGAVVSFRSNDSHLRYRGYYGASHPSVGSHQAAQMIPHMRMLRRNGHRTDQRKRGSALIEFTLVGSFVFLPMLAGLATVGMSMVMALQVASLNSNAGQMLASGVDFTQATNVALLLQAAGSLASGSDGISASGGNGLIILSQIAGPATTGGSPSCIQQITIGNANRASASTPRGGNWGQTLPA